jgi:ATP-dependent RNA helicase DDX19/DBP5
MLLFSATYEDDVMRFASKIIKNPIIMRLRRDQESLDNIKQYYIKCRNKHEKYQAITNIYGVITVGQAIVFCYVSVPWILSEIGRIFWPSVLM